MTIVIGILYAASDEFHQSFSPGRTPKVTDVYIDTLGVILGILLVLFIREAYYKCITKEPRKWLKMSYKIYLHNFICVV